MRVAISLFTRDMPELVSFDEAGSGREAGGVACFRTLRERGDGPVVSFGRCEEYLFLTLPCGAVCDATKF
jgi:hypothetical protein